MLNDAEGFNKVMVAAGYMDLRRLTVYCDLTGTYDRVFTDHQYKKTIIRHDATLGANFHIVCGHKVGYLRNYKKENR